MQPEARVERRGKSWKEQGQHEAAGFDAQRYPAGNPRRAALVSSSMGFDIEAARLVETGQRVELGREGVLRWPEGLEAGAREFSIPGHWPMVFDPLIAGRHVFEPVLGLELSCARLRQNTVGVEVAGSRVAGLGVEKRQFLARWISESVFAVALNATDCRGHPQEPFQIRLHLRDGSVIIALVDARVQGRFRFEVPPLEYAASTCTVFPQVQCVPGCKANKLLKWWPKAEYSTAEAPPLSYRTAWGSVTFDHSYSPHRASMEEGGAIRGLVCGLEYGFGAICEEHDRYGRVMAIPSDRDILTIPTARRIVVSGQVTPEDIGVVRVIASFPVDKGRGHQVINPWKEVRDIPVEGGKFRLRLPSDISINPSAGSAVGDVLNLVLQAGTCADIHRRIELEAGNDEYGEVFDFRCRYDILIVDGGRFAGPDPLGYVLFDSGDGLGMLAATPDGVRRLRSGLGVKLDSPPRGEPQSAVALAYSGSGYSPFAYVRGQGAEFLPVATELHRLTVHAREVPAGMLAIGWRWRGIDAVCLQLHGIERGYSETYDVYVPAGCEAFWWSPNVLGPGAGRAKNYPEAAGEYSPCSGKESVLEIP